VPPRWRLSASVRRRRANNSHLTGGISCTRKHITASDARWQQVKTSRGATAKRKAGRVIFWLNLAVGSLGVPVYVPNRLMADWKRGRHEQHGRAQLIDQQRGWLFLSTLGNRPITVKIG
jgi:hypothetical protein